LEGCVVIVYNEDDVEEPHWSHLELLKRLINRYHCHLV